MKYFIAAGVVSLIAASAYAGGMPEELIEPTKITIEAMDASPIVAGTTTSNPFDQLIQFAFMLLFLIL
tara:strand:- start:202 stop:405 length:204 start_codon:yes stop_codon:yes gene_type:complete